MAIKANIGIPSLKRTKQIELSEEQSKALYDKRLGDKIKGEMIDLPGYEFEITGGSDNAGFPMRRDVNMAGRRKVLLTRSLGNRDTRKGRRYRKTVAGAIVYAGTAQLNLKVLKEGRQPLIEAKEEKADAQE